MADFDDDGECPYCGGEGFTFDCFDGSCEDCDIGCDDCTRPCSHCGIKTRALPADLAEVLAEALKIGAASKPQRNGQ